MWCARFNFSRLNYFRRLRAQVCSYYILLLLLHIHPYAPNSIRYIIIIIIVRSYAILYIYLGIHLYGVLHAEACVRGRLTSLSNGRRSVVATANSICRCRRNCHLRTHITRDHNTATTTYKGCTVAAATNCRHSDRTRKTITLLFRRRRRRRVVRRTVK